MLHSVARMIREKMERDAPRYGRQLMELHGLTMRVEYCGLKWYHAKRNIRGGWDDLTVDEFDDETVKAIRGEAHTPQMDLASFFGLSYASWLTLPRVLMEAMPSAWQESIATLLHEYQQAYPGQPQLGTTVRCTEGGKLVHTPNWLTNYRHPDMAAIEAARREP